MPIADPRVGSELAGYRIERLLGRGGMSVVYRAEDTRLRRRVALKLLAPELAEDERFRERFLRESRLAASLDHPNVIPIYEAGEAGGVLFIAMRYVEGSDLKRLLEQEGRLEPARALALLSQVAEALDVAHEQGLIHRDVKPGNVLIASQAGREHVYLSDFGLTKQTGSESGLTETGQFVGTANYVSPEQVERKPAGAASDQYALGCVLYECLAGEPPYRSESLMGVLYGHASAPIPSLHQQRPELPQDIDPVIARALAKNPEQRYPSCRALIAEARQALHVGDLSTPTPTFTRKRILLAAGGLAAAAAAAAIPAVLLTRRGEEQAAPRVIEPGSVVRIDPTANKPDLAARLEGGRGGPVIAVGEGAVWVAYLDSGTVSRVDPETAALTSAEAVTGSMLFVASQHPLAAGGGAAWAVSTFQGEGKLTEIDPPSGRIRRVHDLGYPDPAGIDTGYGAVWVAVNDLSRGIVLRIDPATGQVDETIPFEQRVFAIVAGEGSVWVDGPPAGGGQAGASFVEQIDPSSNDIVATIPIVDAGLLAAGEGAVWTNQLDNQTIARIDPVNEAVTQIDVDTYVGSIAAGAGAVWAVTSTDALTLTRIDPSTNAVVTTIHMSDDLSIGAWDVAVGAEGVWASVF